MPYMVWGWDRVWEGAGPPRCQAHMPPGRSHLPVRDAPSPAGAFPGDREAAGRAQNEQGPRGIPGGSSRIEEVVGVPGEILGIRIGVSSFLPQQPPQAVCLKPMSYSVSQKLPQKKGREREGGAQKAQLSNSELTHGAERRPAWPPPVVRPDSWGLARSQHLHWAGLGAFRSISSIS